MAKGRTIEVPLWLWNIYWVVELLGADHWLEVFAALIMLALPYLIISQGRVKPNK